MFGAVQDSIDSKQGRLFYIIEFSGMFIVKYRRTLH